MYGNKGMSQFSGSGIAPVNVGDEIDVQIESVGAKGDGIAKKSGFVIFVPGTKQGQTVRVKINKVLKNMSFAEVIGEAQSQPEQSRSDAEVLEDMPDDSAEPEQQSNDQDSEDFGEELEDEEDKQA